jgi:hypothetical protein
VMVMPPDTGRRILTTTLAATAAVSESLHLGHDDCSLHAPS